MLTMVGIFAMRWNVVIGGQLFSKSFLGYTTYKMGFATREGLLPAIILMILPIVILWVARAALPADGETRGRLRATRRSCRPPGIRSGGLPPTLRVSPMGERSVAMG